jgi:hypothetical protein
VSRPGTPEFKREMLYREQVGEAALERQQAERGERHPCCWELVADGHHPACSKRPDDEPVQVHADQASIL